MDHEGHEGGRWRKPLPGRRRRWLPLALSLVFASCAALFLAAEYVLHHAEPLLRERVVATLAQRFHAPVELDRLRISLVRGIEVNGYGLRVGSSVGATTPVCGEPLLAVRHFAFRTSLRSLFHEPKHIQRVRLEGMVLHIPPPDHREPKEPKDNPPLNPAILVDLLKCRDVKIYIEPGPPVPYRGTGPPLLFDLASLDLWHLAPGQPMEYDAELTNPKPVGALHAAGQFGPWANGVPGGPPSNTPIRGEYSLEHADLRSIGGIGGILSSKGRFAGVLDHLTVDGHTDTPDFSLESSNHPVPLHTDFHAVVDGTTGDTDLEPVHARLLGSEFTASGRIGKVDRGGHDIALHVEVPRGRVQDFLRLAVKTSPPLVDGMLSLRANLHIPPGRARVPERMALAGSFGITDVRFSNPKWQGRVNGLSARAAGRAQDMAVFDGDGSGGRAAAVRGELSAGFALNHGVLSFTDVHYAVPGVTALMNGVYSMDGKLFEFKGRVRTVATASEMVGGWKGLLLEPMDHFLRGDGAGVELPVEVSGVEGDLHFGSAAKGDKASPAQLLTEVRGKAKANAELAEARRVAAEAAAEDTEAAHAPTLEAAEQAHRAATRHRAEAWNRLRASRADAGNPL